MIPTIEYGANSGLSYHKERRTFAIEDSTLGLPDIHRKLIIKVAANGHTKMFTGTKRVTDREGDVMWWEYKSDDGKFTLKIFND